MVLVLVCGIVLNVMAVLISDLISENNVSDKLRRTPFL